MSQTCLVCNAIHLEMIDILRHPQKLDYMLKCLLGLQAQQDDYLCHKCCNDVINAFNSKQQFHQFNLFQDESDPSDQFVSEVKIEPESDHLLLEEDVEDVNDGTNYDQMSTMFGLESKKNQGNNAVKTYRPATKRSTDTMAGGKRESNSTSLNVTVSSRMSKEGCNIAALEFESKWSISGEYLQREKSVYVDDSSDKEKPNDETKVVRDNSFPNHTDIHNTYIGNRLTNKNRYKCSECEKSFSTPSSRKFHESIHAGDKSYKCHQCEKRFITSRELKCHGRVHREKLYKCFLCKKGFISNSELKIHESIHTGEKPYKCDKCEKSFPTSGRLKAHETSHIDAKPYKCIECDKCFNTSQKLKVHEMRHTGEKLYKCFECGKGFIDSRHFTVHERSHTSNKPNKCSECGKSFATPYSLKVHERIHTGRNLYKCHECKKVFTTASNLKKHERIHTGDNPYKCCRCGKSFSNRCYLKAHEWMHTGERPYKCRECGNGYATSQYLKIHESFYSEEKFKCRKCEKRFCTLRQLKLHQNTDTGKKPQKYS